MGGGVVDDQVDVEVLGDRLVDEAQEPTQLLGAVVSGEIGDDVPRGHVEGPIEVRRPVAHVVVAASLGHDHMSRGTGAVRSRAWIWAFSSTHSRLSRQGVRAGVAEPPPTPRHQVGCHGGMIVIAGRYYRTFVRYGSFVTTPLPTYLTWRRTVPAIKCPPPWGFDAGSNAPAVVVDVENVPTAVPPPVERRGTGLGLGAHPGAGVRRRAVGRRPAHDDRLPPGDRRLAFGRPGRHPTRCPGRRCASPTPPRCGRRWRGRSARTATHRPPPTSTWPHSAARSRRPGASG